MPGSQYRILGPIWPWFRENLIWGHGPPRCSAQIVFQCEPVTDQSLLFWAAPVIFKLVWFLSTGNGRRGKEEELKMIPETSMVTKEQYWCAEDGGHSCRPEARPRITVPQKKIKVFLFCFVTSLFFLLRWRSIMRCARFFWSHNLDEIM